VCESRRQAFSFANELQALADIRHFNLVATNLRRKFSCVIRFTQCASDLIAALRGLAYCLPHGLGRKISGLIFVSANPRLFKILSSLKIDTA
jgi:hypothetical protein